MSYFSAPTKRSGSSSYFSYKRKDEKYDIDSVNRSLENAIARIEDAGFKVEDADSRNWFERMTNLPEGQNAFFDALDILGRPGQAVLGAVDALNDGENPLKNAAKGFTGQERFRGSDLLEDWGVENKYAKAILGTGLDIATDPLTYVPGGVLLKGVKGAGRIAAAPVKGSYFALENIAPKLKEIREEVVQPGIQQTKDILGRSFVPDYKLDETLQGTKDDTLLRAKQATDNDIRFRSEESMRNVADAAKLAGGVDTGQQAGRIMEAPLRQFEDVQGYEFPDGMRRTTEKKDLVTERQVKRDEISSLGKEERVIRREYENAISATAQNLERVDRQLQRMFSSIERKQQRQFSKRKNVPQNIDELAERRAFEKLSPSPAFNLLTQRRDELKNQLDALRKESSDVRADKISQIQQLVKESEDLKAAMDNPVIIQRELERPIRELSQDPKIQQAAKTLIQSNDEIRNWAQSNGVGIKELEGYMSHILSAEERKRRRNMKAIDRGNSGLGQPNKGVTKARENMGSAEDINERKGRVQFEPNAYFATAIGQKKLIEYVNAVNFRRQVLTNRSFAIPYEKGMDLPNNAVVIDSNNYTFMKNAEDVLEGAEIPDVIGGQYLVTKSVKTALDRYQKLTTDEGINGFLRAFDAAQSFWKRAALFSLPYHLRNAVGAMFNNWVGGMNPAQLSRYTGQAYRDVYNAVIRGDESKLYKEYRQQGLGASSLSQIEFARAGTDPEKAIQRTIERRSKDTKGKVLDRANPINAFETSREFGDFIDQANRFALYKWARDRGMSPQQAAEKVREIQFDYSRTTPFEREILTRAMPFYRWMRNNMPFQIKNFINDPRKYAQLNELRLNLQDSFGINEENVPDWMKEQFALPITGDEEGSGQFLGLNLPVGDLTKITSPLKTLIDSASPLAKLPAELALNRNFFYNKPIEEFEGQQKQFQIPGTNTPFGIDQSTAYALEQLTGQIGRGLSGFLERPEGENKDTKFRMPSLGISSVLKPYDVNQAQFFQQLDRLKSLQDLIDYIEQQTGQRPRTINEINGGQ